MTSIRRPLSSFLLTAACMMPLHAFAEDSATPPAASESALQNPNENWQLQVSLNHANSIYYVGDRLTLDVTTPRAGYLHVVNITPKGDFSVLWPMDGNTPSLVAADTQVSFPDRVNHPEVVFEAAAPVGRELIVCFATTAELDLHRPEDAAILRSFLAGVDRTSKDPLVNLRDFITRIEPQESNWTAATLHVETRQRCEESQPPATAQTDASNANDVAPTSDPEMPDADAAAIPAADSVAEEPEVAPAAPDSADTVQDTPVTPGAEDAEQNATVIPDAEESSQPTPAAPATEETTHNDATPQPTTQQPEEMPPATAVVPVDGLPQDLTYENGCLSLTFPDGFQQQKRYTLMVEGHVLVYISACRTIGSGTQRVVHASFPAQDTWPDGLSMQRAMEISKAAIAAQLHIADTAFTPVNQGHLKGFEYTCSDHNGQTARGLSLFDENTPNFVSIFSEGHHDFVYSSDTESFFSSIIVSR